jgi:hypothetical protein
VSGKANDYAQGSERRGNGRAYRVMFLANIVVGRAFKTEEGSITTPCPPAGYDSVMGEVCSLAALTLRYILQLITHCMGSCEYSSEACRHRDVCLQ